MKKKILGGLLASVIVCLAFVFTNASDPMYSVSGTISVYDENNEIMEVPVSVKVHRGLSITSSATILPGEEFQVSVRCSDVVSFNYSDSEGSASSQKSFCQNSNDAHVDLYYTSNNSGH